MEKRKIEKKVAIHAPVEAVWQALTDKELVRQYFFGTEVSSGWNEGSVITYSGTWKGRPYEDKGNILDLKKNQLLRHSLWISSSGKPDKPENYSIITYELQPVEDGQTILRLTQEGTMSAQEADHASANWEQVLEKLREVTEHVFSHSL